MGLPEAVVTRSRALMGSQAHRLEELILELEGQLEENKGLERNLKAERQVVEALQRRVEGEHAQLTREAKQLRGKAAEEARAIIQEANATVEEAIRTIRKSSAAKDGIREARSLIAKERELLNEELKATKPDQEPAGGGGGHFELRPGYEVYWERTGMAGTVLTDEDPTGTVLVAFGKLKAHVSRGELRLAKEGQKPTGDRASGVEIPVPQGVRPEADMRGMRVEEALRVLDKYLDDALLAGLREVRIIHGMGTGALRKNLIPFLKDHPLVHATRPGGSHQDNLGVTIVEMATK
jgi:DNA mismatch repair protein MutS2